MASRWAYEALAVTQFKENSFNSIFYDYEKNKSYATWKKDAWIKTLGSKLDYVKLNLDNPEYKDKTIQALSILKNELSKELNFVSSPAEIANCNDCIESLELSRFNESVYVEINRYLDEVLKPHYRSIVESNRKRLNSKVTDIMKTHGKDIFLKEKDENSNDRLKDFVLNKLETSSLVVKDNRLIQKKDLIYLDPYNKGFFDAHFYAPQKNILGKFVSTFWANIGVIWLMVIVLTVMLFSDALKKVINFIEIILSKVRLIKYK